MGKIVSNLGLVKFEPHFVEAENFELNETFQKKFHHYATKYGQSRNPIVDHFKRG